MTQSTPETPQHPNHSQHPEAGNARFLSTKTIPPEDRLIFALDVPSVDEAKRLVETLDDAVQFYKVGLELFATGGYFELIEWLVERGNKVFADLKLFGIPMGTSKIQMISRTNPDGTSSNGLDATVDIPWLAGFSADAQIYNQKTDPAQLLGSLLESPLAKKLRRVSS